MKHHNSWKFYLLLLVLVFNFVACKGGSDPKDTSASTETTTKTQDDTKAAPDTTAAPEPTGTEPTAEPTEAKTNEPTEEYTEPVDPRPLVVEDPVFSVKSGFYNEAFQLELSATPGADIRYTLACTVEAVVTNVGNESGKETVILYVELPQGVLGQPSRRMAGYAKTKELKPGESQKVTISFSLYDIASFDETGAVTARIGYVLEKGEYRFYLGGDVRSAQVICCASLPEDRLIQRLSAQMEPIMAFRRMKPIDKDGKYMISYENVPVTTNTHDEERVINLPAQTLPYSGDVGLKLKDVQSGLASMDAFLAQLSDEDLCCIVRGEGMGSPKVTPGTAAAFGGVSENLKNYGIPCACCSDGPSGMRMDSGTKAFSLPNGTLLACITLRSFWPH